MAAALPGALGGLGAPPGSGLRADSVADRSSRLNRQLDQLRETLEGSSTALVDAVVSLRRAQSDLVDADARLAAARSALAQAQRRDDVLTGKLALAQADVAKARDELNAWQQQEAGTRDRLGSIAREAYVSSGLSGLSIALSAQSPSQFADRVNVAGTALREQNGAIARLEVQQAETRARQARLTAVNTELAGLQRESAAVVQQRQDAEHAAAAASSEIGRLVVLEKQSVQTIAARTAAERQRIAALQVQENQLSVILRQRSAARERAVRWARLHHPHGVAAAASGAGAGAGGGQGRLSFPVNAPITSGFGMRFHPILHIWRLHAGTDFGVPCGTPVHAAAPGRIVRAGWAGGFGNQVVIDHGMMRGKDVATSYNHLSRYVVRSGSVGRGQLIAYSGTTGLSTGCHLHFEVYLDGTHVNPMTWL
jgi:murein DD-endopeptidase MepM/ murein hydrolase activator NlpD